MMQYLLTRKKCPYRLCIVVISLSGLSGCSMWVSRKQPPIVKPENPFTRTYPLKMVILGKSDPLEVIKVPLRSLEKRMQLDETSPFRVISSAECGMVAMYGNRVDLAARSLDRAIGLSSEARQSTQDVRRVRKIRGSEKSKVFAGEPHEVAAVFISRGLLYLANDDPENAKSCFLQASLVDAMAEQVKDRSNWLTADVLTALSFKLYGNDIRAIEQTDMMRRIYPQSPDDTGWVDGAKLATMRNSRLTVVVAAVGYPPIKSGQEMLSYTKARSEVNAVRIMGSDAWLTDDVWFQAVTRGRRGMDDILKAKGEWKRSVETGGTVVLTAAGIVGGPALLAAQLVAGAVIDRAQNIDTDADNRYIATVPGRYYVWVTDELQPGAVLTAEVTNSKGLVIASGSVELPQKESGVNVVLAWVPF